jgi:hypothetical protein
METTTGNRTKILIVLNLVLVAGLMYLLSVFLAYPIFQHTRLADPLAEIHALSPLYYIAIALTALLGIGSLIWRVGGRSLHVLLLTMFAVMLWLTPYLLSGFTRMPDAPWHVGIAMQIPQVLAGDPVAFSSYSLTYPGSYVYHYSFVNIAGLQPMTYIEFFPLFCLFFFVLLSYVLLSRLFSTRVAFLAMLLAIPGLHYIQIHASPHTIGALLMLTTLLLLTKPGVGAKIMAIMAIFAIAISHPTTPLLLSIFLAGALFTTAIYSRRIGRPQMVLAGILAICLVCWLAQYSYSGQPQATSPGVTSTPTQTTPTQTTPTQTKTPAPSLFSRIIYQIFPADLNTSQEYVSGTPFIYGDIYNLNKGIYYLYAASGISTILYIMVKTYTRKRGMRGWLFRLGGIKQNEALLVCSIPLLLLLTLLLAEGAHDLIETGLTYIILAISGIVASIILRSQWMNNKSGLSFIAAGTLFLTLSFPVVAYSIDAYSSFPKSEAAGLEFLAKDTSLEGKTVAGSSLAQLGLYSPTFTNKTLFVRLEFNNTDANIVVFRNTYYYYRAMRFDLSFTDNRYTESLAAVESAKYNKIYSSPTFAIYLKGGTA